MSAASRFFFERKLVYPFAFVSFAASFCLCIVLFLKFVFYFFLRNKVVFPSIHLFPPLSGRTLSACSPNHCRAFPGRFPTRKTGTGAHSAPLQPPHACSLSAKPTFFQKKSCPLRILRMAQDSPPKPTYFHKKCFSFLLPSPANQLSFPPKPTFFQLIFMKLCRLSDEEKSGFP